MKKIKTHDKRTGADMARRQGVVLERIEDKIDLLSEGQAAIMDKLDSHKEMIGKLMVDSTIVKNDIVFIKNSLKKKVGSDEFATLEHRVVVLESEVK